MTKTAKRILAELAESRDRAYTVTVVAHPNGGAYAMAIPAAVSFDTMSLHGESQ